ncbi:MAG: hypothetical protein OCD01_02430 [Fibrobacterales bacterium]
MIHFSALFIVLFSLSACSAIGDLAGGGSDVSNPTTQVSENNSSESLTPVNDTENLSSTNDTDTGQSDQSSDSKIIQDNQENLSEGEETNSESSDTGDDYSSEGDQRDYTEMSSAEARYSSNRDVLSSISSADKIDIAEPPHSSNTSESTVSSAMSDAPEQSSDFSAGIRNNQIFLGDVLSPTSASSENTKAISDTIITGNSIGVHMSGADTLTFDITVLNSQTYTLSLRAMGALGASPYSLAVPIISTDGSTNAAVQFEIPSNGRWNTVEKKLPLDAGEYTLQFISLKGSDFTINYLLFD